jgi:hypothetical protein
MQSSNPAPRREPLAFDRWYAALSSALLLPPKNAYIEVRDDEVECRMGWAFLARFPRAAVARVTRDPRQPLSRGVHGYAGRWLVNGSGGPLVAIELEPPQRARVLGVPVTLRQLLVSVAHPSRLEASLASPKV